MQFLKSQKPLYNDLVLRAIVQNILRIQSYLIIIYMVFTIMWMMKVFLTCDSAEEIKTVSQIAMAAENDLMVFLK